MLEGKLLLNDIDRCFRKTAFSLQDWAKSVQWEEGMNHRKVII